MTDVNLFEPKPNSPAVSHSDLGQGWIPRVIFFLSLSYLAFELAFNASLLDVVGQTPDETAISSVEYYGRLLSGLAMALALFPLLIKFTQRIRRLSFSVLPGIPVMSVLLLVPFAFLTVSFSNFLQEEIIHRIETSSNAESRRTANLLLLVNDGLRNKTISFDGLDLSDEHYRLPENKAFLALLPALYLATDDPFSELSPNTRTIISSRVVSQVEEADLYQNYLTAVQENAGLYPQYLDFQDQVNDLTAQVEHATAEIAAEIDWFLNRAGIGNKPCGANAMYSDAVRGMLLRKRQIKLPSNWNLCDMDTIHASIRSQLIINAEDEILSKMLTSLGFSLPLGLTRQEFLSHPEILARACKEAGVEERCDSFSFDLSEVSFHNAFVEPLVQERIENSVGTYLSSTESFADGQAHDEIGYSAIRIAYVPLVAFLFSIAGIWLHVVKATYYLATSIFLPRIVSLILAGTVLSFLLVAPFVKTDANEVLRSPYAISLLESIREHNSLLAKATETILQWQPTLYPLGEFFRNLLGLSFGVA